MNAAYGKMRKLVADDLKVPLHDADIIILLDDWYDSLKKKGSELFSKAKDYVLQNKDTVYPFITHML